MYIRANDNFKKILGKSYVNKIKPVKALFSSKLANSKIIEANKCYYLALAAPLSIKYWHVIVDKVGEECLHNKIYIEDFIDRKLDTISYLLQGGIFGLHLAEKLSKLSPSKFKVIVSCAKSGKDTTVTFHKIRKGEIYLMRNLNIYKIDGLMVIYT